MINAEELKTVYAKSYWNVTKRYGPASSEAGIMSGVIKLLENMPTIERSEPPAAGPSWIPCDEKLPEEDGQYLITAKYKHVSDSHEDVYAEHGEWHEGRWEMFCFGHCREVENIIAWMPLPEPYEERER